MSNIDPSGLILCDYGSSDNGGEDFEDADNSAECFSNGGTLANDSVSVSVNGNNPSDPGITTENGEQIYPTISPNGPGGTPTKVPCTQTTGYKVTQGVLGTANLTLAGIKTVGLVATDGLLGIATPFTGGASAAVAAAGTVYGVTSIGGQAIAGTGQLYTALGGNAQTGEQISQVGDILSGPISGLTTLIGSGGNLAQAQQNANLESTITAGAGLVNSKGFGEAVDFGLSLFGLSGAGCKP